MVMEKDPDPLKIDPHRRILTMKQKLVTQINTL